MIQPNRTYPKTPPTMPPMTPSVVLKTRLIIGSPLGEMSAIDAGHPSTARPQGQSCQAIVAGRLMRSRGDLDRETSRVGGTFEDEAGQARVGLAGRRAGRAPVGAGRRPGRAIHQTATG